MIGVLSSLFDLSGFFFMFTLNLLVICLVCYYFKRRIETLEHAQMEQSKILRTYIQQANNININQDVRKETVQEAREFKTTNDVDETNKNNQFSDQPFKKIEINEFTLTQDEDSQSEDTSDDDDDDDDDEVDDELGENIQITDDNNIKVLRLGPENSDEDDDDDDDDDDDEDGEDGEDEDDDELPIERDARLYEDEEDDKDNDHIDNQDNNNQNNSENNNNNITKNIALEINYNKLTTKELKSICKEKNLTGFNNLKKTDLVELLKNSQIIKQEVVAEISSPSELNLDNVNTLEKNNETIETYNNEKEITLDVIET